MKLLFSFIKNKFKTCYPSNKHVTPQKLHCNPYMDDDLDDFVVDDGDEVDYSKAVR